MFGHKQFLSSFWILVITRFTVSNIRSSLGLLVRDLFRPHMVLVSGFDWLFFIGFTPVQHSLQEYLGGLVDDPIRWILENILKVSPELNVLIWMSWGSDFWTYWTPLREQHDLLSPVTSETYPIRETYRTNTITFEIREVGWAIRYPLLLTPPGFPNPCEFFFYLNCGHDMKPIEW